MGAYNMRFGLVFKDIGFAGFVKKNLQLKVKDSEIHLQIFIFKYL